MNFALQGFSRLGAASGFGFTVRVLGLLLWGCWPAKSQSGSRMSFASPGLPSTCCEAERKWPLEVYKLAGATRFQEGTCSKRKSSLPPSIPAAPLVPA